MKKKIFKRELKVIQAELVHLQRHIERTGQRVVVLFEGRDAAGKGSMIKKLVHQLNPRHVHVVAKGKPTRTEKQQAYFQRWHKIMPQEGEMVILDRSWYTRSGVESVMGFATPYEVDLFHNSVCEFEAELRYTGIIVIKYWLSITHATQEERFHVRLNDLRKRWKLSEMDLLSRDRYDLYTTAKELMFRVSNTLEAPWYIIDANDKRQAKITCLKHLLTLIPFDVEDYEPRSLPSVDISTKVNKEFDHLIIK